MKTLLLVYQREDLALLAAGLIAVSPKVFRIQTLKTKEVLEDQQAQKEIFYVTLDT